MIQNVLTRSDSVYLFLRSSERKTNMLCMGKVTIVLLYYLSTFLYAQGTSAWSIQDLNGTNNFSSLLAAEEKCAENRINYGACTHYQDGFEKFCIRSCSNDGECEITRKCKRFLFLKYCNRMECDRNNDCKNSVCVRENSSSQGYCYRACDCGCHGTCRFEGNRKICDCSPGFVEKDGVCRECDCGYNVTCKFVRGQKTCYCKEGVPERDGVCTGCSCGVNGTCRFKNGKKMCECNKGFEEKFGNCTEICTAEDGCEDGRKCVELAVKGIEKLCPRPCVVDGDCERHMKCSRFFSSHICFFKPCKADADCEYSSICMKESSDQENGFCVHPCDCGNNGTCRYVKGRKICDCNEGYLRKDGTCTECNCGAHGTCRLEKGMKKCDCDLGFVEINGKCTDCVCRGGACAKEGGKKVCKCPPGFGNYTNFSCRVCDCGPDTDCIWQEARFGGDKICLCKPGYSTKKGKCVACDCGPDSGCEWISEGWLNPEKKVCHCKPGYHEKDGKCVDKQELQMNKFP